MDRRVILCGLVVSAAVVAGCGVGAGSGASADCEQARARADDARQAMTSSFGAGPEGRNATRTLVETVASRPSCFDEEYRAAVEPLAEMLPASADEWAAIGDAEAACGHAFGSMVRGGGATVATPEDALQAPDVSVPVGSFVESFRADGRVGYDVVSDGTYLGWVLVAADEAGWYVRTVISCSGDPMTPGN